MALLRLLTLTVSVVLSSCVRNEELPITKVVNLMKDMMKELEVEAKQDKDSYDQIKCWCDSNGAGKTQAVQDQKDKIDQLNSAIEEASSKKGELTVEIDQTKKDIATATASLKEATEIRNKEAAEFHDEETELIKSVTLLKGAIVALSKQHAGLLQTDTELMGMRPSLRKLVHKHLPLLGWLQASRDRDAFLSFINANEDILEPDTPAKIGGDIMDGLSFLQKSSIPVHKGYAAQSGQIFGILKQMKEDFEADLPEIQKEEASKAEAFSLMKGEKESEIKEYQASLKSKIADLASTKETLITAKDDLKDTKASLSADQKFLLEMTERCTQADAEWERRQKMRSDEIEAVSQAIEILTTDEVQDGQQTTFSASFLQVSSRKSVQLKHAALESARRAQALVLLKRAAQESPGLALLLAQTKLDPFTKVIKAIDDLSAKLKLEMADEVKHRDFCVSEFNENEKDTAEKQAKLDGLVAKLDKLANDKKTLQDDIAALKHEISETQVEMQRAAEDRKAANLEFQKIVADQIRTIGALKAAHEKLKGFYFKHSTLVQTTGGNKQASAVPTPTEMAAGVKEMPEMEDYKSNGSSNKVMNLIQKLMGEAQVIKDEAVSDEQNAADAYIKLVGESNDAIKAKSRAITDKTEELAENEEATSRALLGKDQSLKDLESLAATKASLHAQCDFLLDNFTARQKARAAEMDALAEVKAILSGMK